MLGGSIPDTPITINASLPWDPATPVRERAPRLPLLDGA